MLPTDTDTFSAILVEHWRFYSREPPDETMTTSWFRVMRPMPIERVRSCFAAHARRGKFPARPADIFEIATAIEASNKPTGSGLAVAAEHAGQFWHWNDLLVAAHMAWTQGDHVVTRCFDSAMVTVVGKARAVFPKLDPPEAMRSLLPALPRSVWPKASYVAPPHQESLA